MSEGGLETVMFAITVRFCHFPSITSVLVKFSCYYTSTVISILYNLKVPSMRKVTRCIIRRDNVHYLIHVEENAITSCLVVVVMVAA